MKVLTAPFSCMFPSMSVEDTKVTLAFDTTKTIDESMCILHGPPPSLISIFGYAYSKWSAGNRVSTTGLLQVGMLIQGLQEGVE
jgi:hypothetical protein